MFTRATQCMRGVLDPPVSAFSLSLYRHPSIYILFSSRFTSYHKTKKKQILAGELPEESEHFCFFRVERLVNIKGSEGLILSKASSMRVAIPIDLSSRSFIPLPCVFNSRRAPPESP